MSINLATIPEYIWIIIWLFSGALLDILKLVFSSFGNSLITLTSNMKKASKRGRIRLFSTEGKRIELKLIANIAQLFGEIKCSLFTWSSNFLVQVIYTNEYDRNSKSFSAPTPISPHTIPKKETYLLPCKNNLSFFLTENRYARQQIAGALIGFLSLLAFLYADAAQGAQTFSVLFSDDIPPFLNSFIAPLIVASAGNLLVLGIFIGDIYGFTHLGFFSEDSPRGFKWMIFGNLALSLLLSIIVSLVRVGGIDSEFMQLIVNIAQSIIILPMLITTLLLFRGLMGIFVVLAIILSLLSVPFGLLEFSTHILKTLLQAGVIVSYFIIIRITSLVLATMELGFFLLERALKGSVSVFIYLIVAVFFIPNLLFRIALRVTAQDKFYIQFLDKIIDYSLYEGTKIEQTAHEITKARNLESIAGISENLDWLPDDARMEMRELFLGIGQASQHAHAALESETLYNKQEQLRMGVQVIDRIRRGLAYAEKTDLARKMMPALESLKRVFSAELRRTNLKGNIPNVYVSSSPLIKDSKIFKGRKDLFRVLTSQLVSPAEQRPTLLLFGARRMGKTSTLKQLPVQLGPQIIPISIDLQKASTVENAAGLLSLVATEIIKSARSERRLTLPALSYESLKADPYLVFQEWLGSLDEVLGDYYWVLLALDEFESLGGMLADGRVDERIFQLLRGVIQHHPRITVLLSGAHTLEELPPLWSNYFINTKMLKVTPLKKADAIELITRPIPDFPLSYDDDALQFLLNETGCHPNWMQFTCREVVEKLNEEDRFHAILADVEWAINRVPESLAGDFKDMWEGRDSTELMHSILKDVAKGKNLPAKKLDKYKKDPEFKKTLDFIMRRDMFIFENNSYRFRAGLLGRWVARQ